MAGIDTFFWLLALAHMIGDFYLQSEHLACSKKEKLTSLLAHSGLYALPMLLVTIPYIGNSWWYAAVLASVIVSHGVIDFIKVKACGRFANSEKLLFFADQLLHIAVIYLVASIYAANGLTVLNGAGNFLLGTYNALAPGLPAGKLVRMLCAFLLIFKPANVIVKILRPTSAGQDGQLEPPANIQDNKAGSMIGNLERVLMLILLMLGQYTAIAFILTAKSITRYNKIVETPSFAEYYLIGTLTSVLIAVLASLIVK
ncbi:Protein of unknown function [Sporobacter termitidis DSM 10068]|uniref:DUF3307 domain-containing protein n=1 Tax=Sporobacter termitidis DSM 10068 TaxID=1123282 RepID=A0A1M5ZHK5_9FIRM|nr:DUF3307 domain-containing protein [Sporobacter termitidis]SHI23624.1 Protein of unknown function [Sporobacter termitidis DSM 10068]